MHQLHVRHTTCYQYSSPVNLNAHRIYLYPRADHQIRVLDYELRTNIAHRVQWGRDVFDNAFAILEFSEPTRQLEIAVHIQAVLLNGNPYSIVADPRAQSFPFSYRAGETLALSPYRESGASPGAGNVLGWIYQSFPEMPDQTMDLLTRLNLQIFHSFRYQKRDEEGLQTPDETLRLGCGSCRDFAWLFIHACRQMGMAARFVSGYMYSPMPERENITEPADTNTHAWAEVYLPGGGWKGFDPTNGILSDGHFIPCAVGPQPGWISPIQGSYQTSPGVTSLMSVKLQLEAEPYVNERDAGIPGRCGQ